MTSPSLEARVQDFLAQRRIALAGISRTGESAGNAIFQRLKGAGYDVIPINPHMTEFEGEPCYPNLTAIPGGVDGVVLVTRPEVTAELVRQCAEAGITRVWMHQSFAKAGTSVSAEAVAFCRANGITVIDGACPMMYCQPDLAHRCIHWLLARTGGLPQ